MTRIRSALLSTVLVCASTPALHAGIGTKSTYTPEPIFDAGVADEYASQYPTCDRNAADVNGDEVINVNDIPAFVSLLIEP